MFTVADRRNNKQSGQIYEVIIIITRGTSSVDFTKLVVLKTSPILLLAW